MRHAHFTIFALLLCAFLMATCYMAGVSAGSRSISDSKMIVCKHDSELDYDGFIDALYYPAEDLRKDNAENLQVTASLACVHEIDFKK